MNWINLVLSIIFSSSFAFAQLDPSSGLLLNGGSKSSNRENGLDSGRYTVRQRPDINPTPKKTISKQSSERVVEQTESQEEEVIETETKTTAHQEAPAATPTPMPTPSTPALAPQPTPAPVAPIENVPVTTSIDDQKKNLLELRVAPTFIYNHSQSDFSVRDYSSTNPAYYVDINMWIEPTFAVHADFSDSLGASVDDSIDHTRNINFLQQQLSVGIRSRHFSVNKMNSSSLILGIDYSNSQFRVDAESKLRNKLETSGVNLSLLAQIPQSQNYVWEVGFELMPKAKHSETPASLNFQSGDSPDANIISASIGGRLFVDSANQIFWKVHERLEKDQFLGSTSQPDPATNKTLTNVSVTNSTLMIQFGYTWGN